MNKREILNNLIIKIVSCKTQNELKETIKENILLSIILMSMKDSKTPLEL